jgi:hypothetical protein
MLGLRTISSNNAGSALWPRLRVLLAQVSGMGDQIRGETSVPAERDLIGVAPAR